MLDNHAHSRIPVVNCVLLSLTERLFGFGIGIGNDEDLSNGDNDGDRMLSEC